MFPVFTSRLTSRPTSRLTSLGPTALTALGIALGGATGARAQQLFLSNNDALTVNAAGTHGTYQGAAYNTTTTSYSGLNPVTLIGNSAFPLGSGGSLTTNDAAALFDDSTGAVTVSGGTITAIGGDALITGGTGSAITVTGGTFTSNGGTDLFTAPNASIDLYGQFNGLTPGGPQTFSGSSNTALTGSFIGTLENDTVGQTFTYATYGTITLHDVAGAATAPEPASLALGLAGGLPLIGLIAARRRQLCQSQRNVAA